MKYLTWLAGLLVVSALGVFGYTLYQQSREQSSPPSTISERKKLSSIATITTMNGERAKTFGFDAEIPNTWKVSGIFGKSEEGGQDDFYNIEIGPNPTQFNLSGGSPNGIDSPVQVQVIADSAKEAWEQACALTFGEEIRACKTTTLDGQTAYVLEAQQTEGANEVRYQLLSVDHPTLQPLASESFSGAKNRTYNMSLYQTDGQTIDYTEEINAFLASFRFNRVETADL